MLMFETPFLSFFKSPVLICLTPTVLVAGFQSEVNDLWNTLCDVTKAFIGRMYHEPFEMLLGKIWQGVVTSTKTYCYQLRRANT